MSRRSARPSAAFRSGIAVGRAILAAAILVAATIASPHSAGAQTQHFDPLPVFAFSIKFDELSSVSTRRQRLEAAFRQELAAANVGVSEDELAGTIDDAMRGLADWTGHNALRGCSPSGQLCYVIECAGCDRPRR